MEATVGGSGGTQQNQALRQGGEGRGEEPGEMETEVPDVTRDGDETGARTRGRENCMSIFSKD